MDDSVFREIVSEISVDEVTGLKDAVVNVFLVCGASVDEVIEKYRDGGE